MRDVTLDSLRREVGIVFEDAFLFSDTVRANIAYGRPDATDAEVERAARVAGAHEFITELPDGYDTVVGERGLTLSGGQRQRIALARAVLTDPRILVLDDATSSVDARTEEQIHATLREIMAGRTTMLIAHRRSTLRLADRIVLVDDGRVVESGTHEELLAPLGALPRAAPGSGRRPRRRRTRRRRRRSTPLSTPTSPTRSKQSGTVDGVTAALWDRSDAGRRRCARSSRRRGRPWRAAAWAAAARRRAASAAGSRSRPRPSCSPRSTRSRPPTTTPRSTSPPRRRPARGSASARSSAPTAARSLIGFALVVVDTLLTLPARSSCSRASTTACRSTPTGALWAASALFLVTTLIDWFVTWAYTRYTGRTAERLLFALRIRIFAHLQRLSLDYYDRELAGRIMTRMTTDVEALAQLLQTGLITALVSILSFVGVLVVLSLISWPLTLGVLVLVPPLVIATIWFRRRSATAYAHARETISTVNAEFQESLSGVRESQAYVREDRTVDSFRRRRGATSTPGSAPRCCRRSTSRSSCSSPPAATRSCSASAARSCTTGPSPPAP